MTKSIRCPRCKTVTYLPSGGCCGPAPCGPVVCRRCGTVMDRPVRMVFYESLDEE